MDFKNLNVSTKKKVIKKRSRDSKQVNKKSTTNTTTKSTTAISSLLGEKPKNYDHSKAIKKIACTCERCKDTTPHSILVVKVRNKTTNIVKDARKCVCLYCNFAYNVQ